MGIYTMPFISLLLVYAQCGRKFKCEQKYP